MKDHRRAFKRGPCVFTKPTQALPSGDRSLWGKVKQRALMTTLSVASVKSLGFKESRLLIL